MIRLLATLLGLAALVVAAAGFTARYLPISGHPTLILAAARPASAQLTVFDPKSYASSVLQAARALQQIDNQVRMLENQATSLTNQARNLAQLPYSSVQTLQTTKRDSSLRSSNRLAT